MKLVLRQLAKTPGSTLVALLTLALGIGANTGVFSFLHAMLTRPLPLPRVDELVFWGEHSEQVPGMSVAWPNFVDWQERQRSFSDMGVFRGQTMTHVGATETERLSGAQVTSGFWRALEVRPTVGRWFDAEDDKPGAAPTALLGESLAIRMFGSPDRALDQKMILNGEIHTVIGVMPADFQVPRRGIELWVPFGLVANDNLNRGSHPGLYCVGRLKPGVSLDSARADLGAIARQLAQEYPQTNAGNSINMQLLVDRVLGEQRPAAWIAFAAACGVLLIACANVANLLLARWSARAREFALRAAVGATRARLVRMVLGETLVLGIVGTLLGIVVGQWTMDGLRAIVPQDTPFLESVSMNGSVLAFAAIVGVGVMLLFGLVPAITGSRVNLSVTLAAGGRSGGGEIHARWRSILVAGEFALTLVLLFVTGLMIRTLHNLYTADPGLSTERVVSFSFHMPGAAWQDADKRLRVLDSALERLQTLPGVTHVALTNPLPLAGGGNQTSFLPAGMPDPGPGRKFSTENNAASAAYFETMRIPLVRGRTFTDRETRDGERVCVVDTTFAETHWPGEDPIGRRVMVGGDNNQIPLTIIGVVGHVQNYGIGADTRVQLYFSYRQSTPAFISFVLRTTADPAVAAGAIRAAMREVEPTLPVFGIRTMDEIFDGTVTTERMMLLLLSVFAGLALILAAIGLYGVLSYIVGQRTREMGVRMALGASAVSVHRLILGQGLRLAVIGLACGIGVSLAVSRTVSAVLYGVSPYDPWSLGAVVLGLVCVGVLASWLPARRATRVDPLIALRSD